MQKIRLLLTLAFLLVSFLLISCRAPTPTTPPAAAIRQTPLARTPRPAIPTPTPAATRQPTNTPTPGGTVTAAAVSSRPVTIVSSTFLPPDARSVEAQRYYDEAQSYAKQIDFGKAAIAYTQAIQLRPDFSEAYLQRGLAYCFQHDTDDALADWKKIRELPSNTWIDVNTHAMAVNFIAAFSSGC